MSCRIPNQFHFVFGLKRQWRPFHLTHYLCLESCLQVNKPERVYFYYHHKPWGRYWRLIQDKLTLVKVDLVPRVSRQRYSEWLINLFRYAHHADFIRLEKLVEHGGVYADMDTLFVNPLPARLFEQSFVIGNEDDVYLRDTQRSRASLCNAFMMAERGSEFGRIWQSRMAEAFDGTWSNHACFLPQEISEESPELLHVEPSRSFYKHMCNPEGLKTLFEECDPDFEDVYSLHMWNHLWASRWRRDFSDFHMGNLTEPFIREVDTTYNIAARRFLP